MTVKEAKALLNAVLIEFLTEELPRSEKIHEILNQLSDIGIELFLIPEAHFSIRINKAVAKSISRHNAKEHRKVVAFEKYLARNRKQSS